MKEEEVFCGVGEISLGLRTNTSRCFLHRITKLQKGAGSKQSKRSRDLHFIDSESVNLILSTVSITLFVNACVWQCLCGNSMQFLGEFVP